jgi:hypothetical protein
MSVAFAAAAASAPAAVAAVRFYAMNTEAVRLRISFCSISTRGLSSGHHYVPLLP